MYRLSILYDDQEMTLHGPGTAGTVRGARRVGSGPQAAVKDTVSVEVLLEGQPEAILADVAALRRALAEAGEPGGPRLQVQPRAGGPVYQASVRSAALDLPGEGMEARLRGSLTARLKLATGGYWEGVETEIALNGALGGATLGNPGGEGTGLEIAAETLAGDLPAPFRLELSAADEPLGDLYLALDARGGGLAPGLLLEGEQGAGGLVMTDLACSGGAFARCSAPGGQERALLTWMLPAPLLAEWAGRPLRAALRLAGGAPGGVWVFWELRAGGAALSSTVALRLEPGATLALLPALRLPYAEPSGPVSACLAAQADEDAQLDVDFLHLLPQDGFQRLSALWPLPAGDTLVLDGASGQVYQRGAQGCLPGHLAAGAAPRLRPARVQRLFVLHPGAVSATLTARAWMRPRWSEV